MAEDYFIGTDVLGAEDALSIEFSGEQFPNLVGAADPGPFVVIHVKDPAALVAAQGGATGSAAFGLVPQTITSTIYSRMRDEIAKGMQEKGVDADVRVVDNRPPGGPGSSDFLVGSVVGAAVVGVTYGLIKLAKFLFARRK